MRQQSPQPSTSVGRHFRSKEPPQVRRPAPEMGGLLPPEHTVCAPSASALSCGGGGRGFPMHRATTSVSGWPSPDASATISLKATSELSGMEFLPHMTELPSTGTKRLDEGKMDDPPKQKSGAPEEFKAQLLEVKSEHQSSNISAKNQLSKCGDAIQEGPTAAEPCLVRTSQRDLSSVTLPHVQRTQGRITTTTQKISGAPRGNRSRSAVMAVPIPAGHMQSSLLPESSLPLPKPALRRKNELQAQHVMGDATCYGVWKTEIDVCTATSNRTCHNEGSHLLAGFPVRAASSTTLLEDSSQDEPIGQPRPRMGTFENVGKSAQPEYFTESSEMAPTGGFKDLSLETYASPDDRALELTVDITHRHRASVAAQDLPTSSDESSSLTSFVKRVSAAVTVRRGARRLGIIKSQQARLEPLLSEPSKAPEESPIAEFQPKIKENLKESRRSKKQAEEVEYGWPVDYERFLPHSSEALKYAQLLKYPQNTRKASIKKDASIFQREMQDESEESPSVKPLIKENVKESKRSKEQDEEVEYGWPVDYERFLPDSSEAISYTELLKYPPSDRKASIKKNTSPFQWEVQDERKASPPVDKSSSESTPAMLSTRRISTSKPIDPSKGKTMSQTEKKPTSTDGSRRSRKSQHDVNQQEAKPAARTKNVNKKTEKAQRRASAVSSKGSEMSLLKGCPTQRSPGRRSIPVLESKSSPRSQLAQGRETYSQSLSKELNVPSRKSSLIFGSPGRQSITVPESKPTVSSVRRTSASTPIGQSKRETTPLPTAKHVEEKVQKMQKQEGRIESFATKEEGSRYPYSPGRRTIKVRPLLASFHYGDKLRRQDKEADPGLCLPSSPTAAAPDSRDPKETTLPTQAATVSRGVRRIPMRPFIMDIHDISNVDHSPRELSSSPQFALDPQMENLVAAQSRSVNKQPVLKGTRPYIASVHDNTAGIIGTSKDVKLLIAANEPNIDTTSASRKTSAIRSFDACLTAKPAEDLSMNTKFSGQETQRGIRRETDSEGGTAANAEGASGHTRSFRDAFNPVGQKMEKEKTHMISSGQNQVHELPKAVTTKLPETVHQSPLLKPTAGPSPAVRIFKISTMKSAHGEMMLWDYSPKLPPKIPQLQAKQAPIFQTSSGSAIRDYSKVEDDRLLPSAVPPLKVFDKTPDRAAKPQPTIHSTNLTKETAVLSVVPITPQPSSTMPMTSKETTQALLSAKADTVQEVVHKSEIEAMLQPATTMANASEGTAPGKQDTPKPKASTEVSQKKGPASASEATTQPAAPKAKAPNEAGPASAKTVTPLPTTPVSKDVTTIAKVQSNTPSGNISSEEAPAKADTRKVITPTIKVSQETGISSATIATPQTATTSGKLSEESSVQTKTATPQSITSALKAPQEEAHPYVVGGTCEGTKHGAKTSKEEVSAHDKGTLEMVQPQASLKRQITDVQKINEGEEKRKPFEQQEASERSRFLISDLNLPPVVQEGAVSTSPEAPALVPAKKIVQPPDTDKADRETGIPRGCSNALDISKAPDALNAAQATEVSKSFQAREAIKPAHLTGEQSAHTYRYLSTDEKAPQIVIQTQKAEDKGSSLKTCTIVFRSPLVSPQSTCASSPASQETPGSKTPSKTAVPSLLPSTVASPASAAPPPSTNIARAGLPGKHIKQPTTMSNSYVPTVLPAAGINAEALRSPVPAQPTATEPVATRPYILSYRSPSRSHLESIADQVAPSGEVHKSSEVKVTEGETRLPKREVEARFPNREYPAAKAPQKHISEANRKARGIHKCAKHMNETEAEYEQRKARAKAKAKAKATAEEEEPISGVKRRSRKSKSKENMKKPLIRDASQSPAKRKDQLSQALTSDHYIKGRTFPSCACCIIVLALLLIFLLLLYFLWWEDHKDDTITIITETSPTTEGSLKAYYCSTDVCLREADYLKSLISQSKKPCDDFYEYVCEGWTKVHPVPGMGTGAALSADTLLQDRLASDIEPVLLGMSDIDVKTAAALHKECMRRDKVGQDGDTVVNVARELFQTWAIKEWPVFKVTTVTQSTVWLFAGELVRDLNVAALASVTIGVSPKVLEAAAIELGKPRLVFSCNDASRPAVTKLFKDALMEAMNRFASATVGDSEVSDVMRVFIRLGSSPALAASPDTGPLHYTNVKLIELDTGFKNFLEGVFNSIITIDGTTEVVLKFPDYLRNHLPAAMQELSPHVVANYLGFMALVKVAPFFPEKFSNLRQVFSKDVLERTLPDVSQTKALCLLAVQQVLPACFAKAAVQLRNISHTDLPLAEWLSRLESSFSRHHERAAWMNELSALIVRYRLKRNRMVALPSRREPCAPSPQEVPRRSEHPLRFFHQVSMLQEQKRLQVLLRSGKEVLAMRGEARSELATIAEYSVIHQGVHVPMALFNTSVRSNTTMFAFHLSRVAVRLYRALVQVLFPNNIYERVAPIPITEETTRRLDDLLSCFEKDLRVLPASLRGPVSVDSAKLRGALLQHVAAVKFGFRAFRDHLNPRRIWHADFRLQGLPDFSADALFFLYYALDNCESADTVYAEHRGVWMPAHYRVNAALRHVDEFARVFGCRNGDQMAPSAQICRVLKKD